MFITRRRFLKRSLRGAALLTASPSVPLVLFRTSVQAAANTPHAERTLIVVQLTGGNDGLNTVVPYGDDLYARSRPTLRLPADQVHKIDDYLGFHPRMAAFSRL